MTLRTGQTWMHEPMAWLGLAWVYGAIGWLILAGAALLQGDYRLSLASVARVALTLLVGVWVCGVDRRGWAAAITTSAIYTITFACFAALVGYTLATRPGFALSWQPAVWLIPYAGLPRTLFVCICVVGAGLTNLILLWRQQRSFDVPDRRPFTTLVGFGLLPTVGMVACDTYIIARVLGAVY